MDRIDEHHSEERPQDDLDRLATVDNALRFTRQHPTLLATVALSFVVVLKLIVVARGSLTTAEALLTSAGPVIIGLGILLTLFPAILFILSLNSLLVWVDLLRGAVTFGFWHFISVWLLMLDVYFLTLIQLLMVVVLAILFIAIGWLFERKPRKQPNYKKKPYVTDLVTVIVLMLSLFFLNDSLWVPAEQLIHGDSSSVVVGYVAQADADWITVVRESDRHVLRLRMSTIHTRELCRLGEDTSRSFATAFERPPEYPLCYTGNQDD